MRSMKVLFSVLFLFSLLINVTTVLAEDEAYIVKPGDSLTHIARRYGLTVTELAAANGLRWDAWLHPGQQLTIPGQTTTTMNPATVTDGDVYIVQPGDTLTSIAIRYSLHVDELIATNNLTVNGLIYIGQRLVFSAAPTASETDTEMKVAETADAETAIAESTAANGGVYVVQPGNTLFSIARWHNTTVAALMSANGLRSYTIYTGQRLTIPDGDGTAAASLPPTAPVTASGEKWIDVNLTTQTVTAYQGWTPVYSAFASTGTWATPTVVGTFHIYAKYVSTTMSGPGYHLDNVPHTMYLYRGT